MSVIIGSAKSSYGNTSRGDQNGGREVATENWYKHSKGWRAFRAKDPAKRWKLAQAMKAFCADDRLGYSQPDRLALFNQLKPIGFSPANVHEKTNCDCSSLVRVCCYCAGITPKNFITSGEASALMETGEFVELTNSKYTTKSDYLCAGDILVTKTKGHTVIVITSGAKCEVDVIETEFVDRLGDRILSNGCEGVDVKELQLALIERGFSCGDWGADGEFGDCTESAVREFQSANGLVVNGIVDSKMIEILTGGLEDESGSQIKIVGGNCYCRKEPNTNAEKLGVVYKNTTYTFANEISADGWYKIVFHGVDGWVSGKYGRLGG